MTGFKPTNNDELLLTDDGHYHGPRRHRRPSRELSYETLAQIDPALVVQAASQRTGIPRERFQEAIQTSDFEAYVQGMDR